MNLDNRKEAQPTVQVSREITTTNGCKVTLMFAEKEDPNLQHDVAEMLLAAFIKRRSMLYEASSAFFTHRIERACANMFAVVK